MGTDVYITNIRMYDITDNNNSMSFSKEGIIYTVSLIENSSNCLINNIGEIQTTNLIEY